VIVDYIDDHRHRFGVEPICAALRAEGITIAPSGYYAAKKRPPSRRSLADAALAETIEATFWDREKGRGVYGARKMWHQLRRDGVIGPAGLPIARCTVERLMRELGLRGARRGRPVLTTRADRRSERAPDLVDRNFTAAAPNRLWVADATRIPCGEGVFWLAAVRDVFSRRIVGWKTSDRCDTDLILAALEYGIFSRDVRDGQLIHHSDRGSNYTSFRFSQRLQDNGIRPSMGSVGDSYDNALMENFWSTLKIELVYRTSWRTRDEAENAIFEYIDTWYNTRRIQKELGYLSPDEYETAWHAQTEPDNLTPAPTGSR